MHRYEELEKLYYKRVFFKYFLIFLIVVILFIILNKFIFNNKRRVIDKDSSSKLNKNIDKNLANNNLKFIIKAPKDINFSKSNTKLSFVLPKFHILKLKEINKTKEVNKTVEKVDNKKLSSKISVYKIEEDQANVIILIEKFKKNPNYNLAITIAKVYLQKNNLKRAKYWLLKANSISPDKPDSWLLFADILLKEHKIHKARELLETYLDEYGDNDKIIKKLRSINE